jgi:cyclic beta-1,2-glucan synthetase
MATVPHSPVNSGSSVPPGDPGSSRSRYALSLAAVPRASATENHQKLRAEALRTAQSCSPLPPSDMHARFAATLAASSKEIGRFVERLQNLIASGTVLRGDCSGFLSHLMAIRTASRECRQAFRSKAKLPCVRSNDSGVGVPRVYALSTSYLDAADDNFTESQFLAFAQAIQESSPLEMKELWNLRAHIELALLERMAEVIGHLQKQPSSQLSAVATKNSSKLRRCAESLQTVLELDWKELFEEIDQTGKILKTDPLGDYSRMDFESRDAYRAAVARLAARSAHSEAEVAQEAIVLARQAQKLDAVNGRAKERRMHVGYYLIGAGQEALKRRIGFRSNLFGKLRTLALRSPDYFYFVSIEIAALVLLGVVLSLTGARPPAVWPVFLLLLAVLESGVMITNSIVTSLISPKKLPKLDFSEGIPSRCATVVVVPTLLTSEKQVRKSVKDLEVRFLGNRDPNLHFALLTDPPDSKEQFDDKDALAGLCSELVAELNRTYASRKNGSFFHFHRSRSFNAREGLWMGWERKRGKLLQFNRYLTGQEDAFSLKTGDLSLLSGIRYVITLDLDTQLPPGSAHRMVGALAHPLNSAVIDPKSNIVVEGYGILQPRVEISVQSAHRSRLASLFSGETGLDIYTRAVSDVYQDLFGEAIFSGKGIYEVASFQKVLDNRLPCDSILSHDLIESAYARAGLLSDVEVVDDYPSTFSALNRRKHRWIRGDWQVSPWIFGRVRDAAGRMVANPITHVSRWKIFDNLRRALTDATVFAALLYGWFVMPQHAVRWTLVVLGVLLFPIYFRLFLGIANAGRDLLSLDFWKTSLDGLKSSHERLFLRLAFLFHQAVAEIDAAVRSFVRMKVTRRRMLEWETAADAESDRRRTHPVDQCIRVTAIASVALGVLVAVFRPEAIFAAIPFLLLWAALPKVIAWFDQPSGPRPSSLDESSRALIRNAGLRTWRFFREFSNAEENWLVPDLLQQTPPLVAHRISTTNLGLLLNARLAAYDLGHLSAGELAESTEKTFEAVARMPKCDGQLYNWYSTHTLQPDQPLFVSTVDNGNLLCSLWTLKEGCREILRDAIIRPVAWQSIHDHVELIRQIIDGHPEAGELRPAVEDLRQRVASLSLGAPEAFEKYATLELDAAIFFEKSTALPPGDEIRWWAGELQCRVKQLLANVRQFAPWLLPEYAQVRERVGFANIPRLSDLTLDSSSQAYAALEKALRRVTGNSDTPGSVRAAAAHLLYDLDAASSAAELLRNRLSRIARSSQSLADGMDFSMFFDEKREMLAIGYDADAGSISKWHYDLLPSEARSAAFGGIAQGTIPHKTWFRLGRFHGAHNGEPLLYSWAGTMFEYLMPCLWTRSHRNSLLERSARTAVLVQRKFAEEKGGIPWGVSECACNEYTADGHYVYHAFGVPTLALHRDEYSKDVVIAPYATFLAMMVEPIAAARNLAKMQELGWLGAYGFYDAIDFTSRRIAHGKQHEIVRTWMAHHQGMSLVAISNTLCDSAMQRRFHADSRVAAAERVLHEKAPRILPAWEQEIVEAFRPSGASPEPAKSAA